MAPTIYGFESLRAWLGQLPDQVVGFPAAVCETGEPYVEFLESALSRVGDAETIERSVAQRMATRLCRYLEDKEGRIYWRTPLESDKNSDAVVVRYDENGPDREFSTDRKCLLDKDWLRISCYCRLYRATLSCGEMLDWAEQQKAKVID